MIFFSMRGLYWTRQYLEHIKGGCMLESITAHGATPAIDVSLLASKKLRQESQSLLVQAETQCRTIGLDLAADTAVEIRKGLEHVRNIQWLLDRIVSLQKLLEKEAKGRMVFYSPPERAKFFPIEPPFGEAVAVAFPSAVFDTREAATCLALMRGTASVFHLMRVLEIGLSAFGSVFGVSLAHTNWGPSLNQVESKIREMHRDPTWRVLPDCKSKQEAYAQAASHFGILKDAWRNYTMHARGKYDEEQAEQLFHNVKGFMQKLESIGLREAR